MEEIFVILYPLLTINTIIGYLPQIRQLVKADKPTDDISLSSWYMWIFGSVIALGYGLFHLQDFMFCVTTGVNLVLMVAVVALVLYNKHIRFVTAMQPAPIKVKR